MIFRLIGAVSGLVIMLGTQPASAADYLFKGDCERADLLVKSQSLYDLFPFARYEGVRRTDVNDAKCQTMVLTIFSLKLSSARSKVFTYDLSRVGIVSGHNIPGCNQPSYTLGNITGKMTLQIRKASEGELCAVYIDALFKQTDANNLNWHQDYAARVVVTGRGTFLSTEATLEGSTLVTPITFVAVPSGGASR